MGYRLDPLLRSSSDTSVIRKQYELHSPLGPSSSNVTSCRDWMAGDPGLGLGHTYIISYNLLPLCKVGSTVLALQMRELRLRGVK